MDRRISLLKIMAVDDTIVLRPECCTASPCGYAYPRAQAALGTRPGGEIAALQHLADLGYLDRETCEVVHLCPACEHYELNFREVCPTCLGPDLTREEVLHHYKCGHVGLEATFRRGVHYICPKCHEPLRHIGVDYERPAMTNYCRACKRAISDTRVTCQCVRCTRVFPEEEAIRRPLYAYRISSKGLAAAEEGSLIESAPAAILDPALGLYTWEFLTERLSQEIDRSRRYDNAVTLLMVSVRNAEGEEQVPARTAITRDVIRLIKESVRTTELIACYKRGIYGVILPETPEGGARVVAARISKQASERIPDAHLATGMASFGPGVQSAEQLLETALARMEGVETARGPVA